jgi:hypothetical protein
MATVASVYPLAELERQRVLTDAFSVRRGRESSRPMKLHRTISTHLERSGEGFSVRAAIDAVVAVNVDEPASAEHSRAGGD